MKNEGTIETSLNINKKYFHKKSTSNYNGKNLYNKIPSSKKINISSNKPQETLNRIKIKIKNNQKSIPKLNNESIGNNKIKKIRCIDKINSIESLNKVNINSKTIQHIYHADTEYDNSLKKYPTSTIASKNRIIISKKNKNSTLIKCKMQRNSEILNLNRSKNDFSTNFLFKSNRTNSKDLINKTNKKGKNLFISYLVKKVGNKNNSSENKIYNSNHNILTLNRNILNRDISKRICKNNTSSQLQRINKVPNHNNSSMIQSASSHLSHNENNVHNLYFNEKNKMTTINIIKKFIKIYTSGNSYNNNLILNNNFFFPSQKNFDTLNHNKSNNYIKHSNITDTIDNSNINYKKVGKNYLKKKIKVINNNNFDKEKLIRFKTEKELELVEVDKNMYQLIQKKKKRIYLDSKDLSQKKKLSFDLNKNENLKKIYIKLEKSEDLEKNIEMTRNLISPIKDKDKKERDTHLCLTNETLKKKNLINRKSKEKVNGSKNKKATNINEVVRKREKKNLSIQIETKYIYQKNNIFQNDRYRKFLIEKNNVISENNANDLYNNTNTYNTIQTKPINPFDSSNNHIRNNNSDSKYNHNFKNMNNNLKTMNKSRISTIDFDNINKKSKNKTKEKVLKKKKNNSKIKIKNVKIKNICKINISQMSNENKVKFLRKKYNKQKKIEINDEIDDKITYINDSFLEEDLDEDYLVRDTTQSTKNMTKINTKMKSHFMNVLKHRNNLKLKSFPKVLMPLLSIFKEKNIINKILFYCDYDTLNKLCLINKEHYKYLKPIIYEKIKLKIIEINKSSNNLNNVIKKSILIYTPLSKLSKIMLQKNYFDLLYEVNEKYEVDIKKDLLRTLPDDISFKYGKENYNKLYHILSAYSNYNKNIGYAQGLNFLAAICLCIFKDEIDSFIFLDGLIQKFKFENLFGIKNDELNVKLKEIECCVDKWCPEIKKYLQTKLLNYDFFTCKWMITLFSNSMNIKYLFQLWDYMIIFGWKFFKFFVIAVIKFNEIKILNCSLEKITKTMNEILKTREFEDNFINIINITFQYINKDNEII